MAANIQVKQYKSQQEFERDAQLLAAQGWAVQSVVQDQQRSGCLRMLTIGLFALIWKPKPRIMVTYTRQAAPPAP